MENFSYQMLKGNAIVFSFIGLKNTVITTAQKSLTYTGGR
jgi:tRNA A37 threonylcarbamoyltransferase TsaD